MLVTSHRGSYGGSKRNKRVRPQIALLGYVRHHFEKGSNKHRVLERHNLLYYGMFRWRLQWVGRFEKFHNAHGPASVNTMLKVSSYKWQASLELLHCEVFTGPIVDSSQAILFEGTDLQTQANLAIHLWHQICSWKKLSGCSGQWRQQ